MNDLYHMNQAMQYIEDNLSEGIDYKELARIALTSKTYFKRLFSFLSGTPLSEYIRNRRLTQAAFELTTSEIKVIDLALKYGYTSPDAFTKAFHQFHKVTPTSVRKLQSNIRSYPTLTFRLDIHGEWDAVNDAWTRIYTEWFPSSKYEPADSPQFMVSNENESEVWVAVR